MSRQDKATTDRNARTLRELVKQPDNKNCADCRKNDARWASWNLGVFLCIRCSGIHRSMGTHISKVKSIDLDMWTPEQMDSVQKWGNRRANLYWEKHLKAGHIPADHKIESFIRSKYESKRWAMDGSVPSDPSVLENGGGSSQAPAREAPRPTPTSTAPPPAPAASARHPLLSRTQGGRPVPSAAPAPAPVATPAPLFDLFADDEPASTPAPAPATTAARARTAAQPTQPTAPAATTGAAPPAPTAQPTANSSIFDLDFHAPTQTAKPQTAKADIMSLFSTASSTTSAPPPAVASSFFNSPAPAAASPYGSWSGGVTSLATPTQHHPTQTGLPTGGSSWGGMQMDQNAWGAPQSASQPQSTFTQQAHQSQAPQLAPPRQTAPSNANVWGSSDPWSSGGNANGTAAGHGGLGMGTQMAPPQAAKKDDRDPFANLWA